MHKELTNCQVAMARGIIHMQHPSLPDVQKSFNFKRDHSTNKVDKLSSIYSLVQIKEENIKVITIVSYLVEDVLMWW